MTYDQLRMLVQIVEKGSVIAAAESLYRTQPAVSIAMKKLEEELEVDIFDHQQYRATLTPQGQILYRKAKVILQQTEDFEALGKQLGLGYEPQLKIAFEGACPLKTLLELLRQCEIEFPCTEINLSAEYVSGAQHRLLSGDVDLALFIWEQDHPELESLRFTKMRFVAVVAPDFPLLRKESLPTMEEMKDYIQVIVRDSSLQKNTQSYGVLEGARHWSVNDHATKKEIILSGMGWGRLPEHIVAQELREGRLCLLEIEGYPASLEVDFRIVRRRHAEHGPVSRRLWEILEQGA